MPFPRFHGKHKPGPNVEPVPEERFERYAGKLPTGLLDEWREHGFRAHGNAFLWTVDPCEFAEVLDEWLDDSSGCHAVVRTAFGGIFYWTGDGMRYLDVLFGGTSAAMGRMDLFFDGLLCDDGYLKDVLRRDVFAKALRQLGTLEKDQCYGFLPPLAMGGPGTLETVMRVDLRVHLAILAQVAAG